MNGKLYGVGVGPGSPELMTLKAVNCIKKSDIICIPTGDKLSCRAYQIAKQAIPEIAEKECICLDMKMTWDSKEIEQLLDRAQHLIQEKLSEGKSVSFLTIGDSTVYSSFGRIAGVMREKGFDVETINGITSFTAVAADLGILLSEEDEEIHIGTGQSDIETLLRLSDTKVIMKAGKNMPEIKRILQKENAENGILVYAVSDCGTEKECRYYNVSDIPDDAEYMTTLIIKSLRG